MLASGSKGNCIYIGNETDAVIIDAGMGHLRRTLKELNFKSDLVRALCITHEHTDHVSSAKAFLKAAKVPVLATGGTLNALTSRNLIPQNTPLVRNTLAAGSLTVTAFGTCHDAAEPCGFTVQDADLSIGVCLDTAKVTASMKNTLAACDAVILESNYSTHAMKTDTFPGCRKCRTCGADCGGSTTVPRTYPEYLKDRIRSSGHLSNEAAATVLKELAHGTGILALAHLSENYNRPNLARTTAENVCPDCEIYVSDQLPEYRKQRMVRFRI
jgi:phosphoribosyl 1,2-cyclic phosphodiesterase